MIETLAIVELMLLLLAVVAVGLLPSWLVEWAVVEWLGVGKCGVDREE